MSIAIPLLKALETWLIALLMALVLCGGATPASAQGRTPPRPADVATPTPTVDVWLRRLAGKYQFDGSIQVVFYPPEDNHGCGPLPEGGPYPRPIGREPSEGEERPPPVLPWNPYCSTIKGVGDCIGIGTGPGVQCVLNVTWQDMHDMVTEETNPDFTKNETGIFNLPGGVAYLSPAVMLFGLDPGHAAISYLLVDNKGLPEGGTGQVNGNRATFKTTCVNAPVLLDAIRPPTRPPRPPGSGTGWRTCDRVLYIDAKPDARVVNMSMEIRIDDEPFTRIEMTLRREPATPAK
jgi:hypothetical protein